MKQKLFLVSALFLAGTSAFAQWEKPTYTTQQVVTDGTPQYLLNVDAQAFMLGANDWSTRASVSTTKGYKYKIESTSDSTYCFTDSVETAKAWKKMFTDGISSIWVDNNAGSNCDSWQITKGANNTFKISNTAWGSATLGVAGTYDGATGNTRLYFSSDTLIAEGTFMDTWTSVSVEDYNDYAVKVNIYEAALALKAAIDEAREKYSDLDLAAEEAVYNNSESTLEELNAAAASVAEKLAARSLQDAIANASYTNPFDLSFYITNATFDKVGDFTGWKGSGFGAGGTTSTCAERYSMKFDTYQDIDSLPNGVYLLSVDGFFRQGGIEEDFTAYTDGTVGSAAVYAGVPAGDSAVIVSNQNPIMHLFQGINAGDNSLGGASYEKDGATYYVPNTMADFTKFNNAGYYKTNSVLVGVVDGKIRIGVLNTEAPSNCWTIVDNFALTYYGEDATALAKLVEIFKASNQLGADVKCTVSLKEEYNKLVNDAAVNSMAQYKEVLDQVANLKNDIAENVALWKEYEALVAMAKALCDDPQYASVAGDLSWAVQTAEGNISKLTMTTAQLKAAIKNLNDLYEDSKSHTPDDTDVTKFITNPDFANGTTGWVFEHVPGGNVRASSGDKCAEAFNNADFNIYQQISNVTPGLYEIQVQGFYRYLRGDNAWNAYFNENGTEKADKPVTPVYVYMNDAKTAMRNVFEYQTLTSDSIYKGSDFYSDKLEYINGTDTLKSTYSYPNDMKSAGIAFDRDAYVTKTFGLVAAKGDTMQIGMKGSSNQGDDSWAIFTRFKLIYRGYQAKYIRPILEEIIPSISYAEIEKKSDVEGQFIGADVVADIETVYEQAQDAVDGEDGKTMVEALNAIYKILDRVDASIALFKELHEGYETFSADVISDVEESRDAVVDMADEFISEMDEKLDAETLTDAEAKAALDKIVRLTAALKLPSSVYDATEEVPVDITAILVNPSFEQGSTTGWSQSGSMSFGAQGNTAFGKDGDYYAELWHKDATLNMYQTLDCLLPMGKYELQVLAHCSTGDGVIYLNEEETAISNDYDASAPNCDTVRIELAANCMTLKVGVKATLTSTTWCCVDNFKLLYLGGADGKETAIQNLVAARKETTIFDLNGRKVATLQKGINLVRTIDADGNVTFSKVLVK